MTTTFDTASLYLTIDQGGHASRALIFDRTGTIVSSAHVAVDTLRPEPFRVEHDASALLQSVRTVIGDALTRLGDDGPHVITAGLATQRSSIVCWNRRSGAPLSPVLSWQDTRAAAWLRTFEPRAKEVREHTGLRLSPHYGASKLRWCLDNLAAVQQAQAAGDLCCGPLASFLAQGITTAADRHVPSRPNQAATPGTARPAVADPANASRTLLWNVAARNWDPALLRWFGIPRDVLPESVPTRHCYGEIPRDSLRIPLALVTGDQSAALFALGLPRPDTIYLNLGTGAFLQYLTESVAVDHPALLRSVVYADDQRALYALEGTINGAGSALSWFADQQGLAPADVQIERWLTARGPIPLFINSVAGLGSPYWISQIEPHFVGEGDLDARGCAILESIMFLVAANIEAFRQAGIVARALVVSGGLAQFDGLCQGLADLCGLPVNRPQIDEATARGVAQLLSDFSLPSLAGTDGFTPRPNPERIVRQAAWRRVVDRMSTSISTA